MRSAIFIAMTILPFSTIAGYTQSGNTLTFEDDWWQVENRWPASGIVCSGNADETCELSPGDYKWVGTTGKGYFNIAEELIPPSHEAPIIQYVRNSCVFVFGEDPELFEVGCTAECPVDTQVVGAVSCSATTDANFGYFDPEYDNPDDGSYSSAYETLPMPFSRTSNGISCYWPYYGRSSSVYLAEIVVEASCL